MTALLAITLLSLLGIALALLAWRDERADRRIAEADADKAVAKSMDYLEAKVALNSRLVRAERDVDYWHKLHDQLLGRRSRRSPETPAPLPENAE